MLLVPDMLIARQKMTAAACFVFSRFENRFCPVVMQPDQEPCLLDTAPRPIPKGDKMRSASTKYALKSLGWHMSFFAFLNPGCLSFQ